MNRSRKLLVAWRVPFWAGLFALAVSTPPAWAQVGPEADAAGGARVNQLLQYVQLRVVAGRLVASSVRQGISLTTESRDLSAGRWERLTLDLSNPAPGLRYENKSPKEEVVIEISNGDHLIARRVPKGDTAGVEFEQRPTGDLTLTVGAGAERRTIHSATLWHLLLVEPEAGRKQLIPLLETLWPSAKLSAKAAAIEAALLRWSEAGRRFDRARLGRLVQALGDPQYTARRAAERDLADIGEPALMYLAALRRSDLDAEQWQRVQTLLASLSRGGEDTVDRSVVWLAGDPAVWLALLERDDASIRQSAGHQLELLLSVPIDFDSSAAPDQRAAQIKRLRTQIEKQEAAEVQPSQARLADDPDDLKVDPSAQDQ